MNSSAGALKRQGALGQTVRDFIKGNGAVVIFVIIFLCACIFIDNFASVDNMFLIIRQSAIPLIACIGMTMVLMTGGIDLSLGYNIGFSSIVVGLLIKTAGLPVWFGILAALASGAVVGLINGTLVEKIHVPAFITTLGTGYILFGAAQIVSKGNIINKLPEPFLAIGKTNIGKINTTVLIGLAMALIFYVVLQRSTFGRSLAAFGFNKRAAYISGVATEKLHVLTYVLCGTLASLAGILLTIRVNCAQPDMGGGDYTFEIVTAAVVGGASLFGGKGTIVGSLCGVLIIKIIESCINLYKAVMGIVILLALIFESVKNRKL